MGGLTLYGSLAMGVVLVVGHRWFPDNVVMWFASPDGYMVARRELLVAALAGVAIVRQYYHNLYLQLAWGFIAIMLLRAGGLYFLDNPVYVFDTMLMLGAGLAFAMTALMPGEDPVNPAATFGRLLPKPLARQYSKIWHAETEDVFATWRHISDSRALSHRLVVKPHLKVTVRW